MSGEPLYPEDILAASEPGLRLSFTKHELDDLFSCLIAAGGSDPESDGPTPVPPIAEALPRVWNKLACELAEQAVGTRP